MKLRFADGHEIEVKKGSVVEYLYRNEPKYLREYLDYLERQNQAFRYIDYFLQRQ